MSFVRELKRRNVFRVGVAYVIIAWLLLQVSDTLVPALHLPEWFSSAVALLLILGFPLAVFFAWAFELTPQGIKKEKDVESSASISSVTGRKLDFAIIGLLSLALGYFGYDRFVLDPDRNALEVEAAVQAAREQVAMSDERSNSIKSIAVLAFVNMSDDPGNEYFSDGLSEEILNLLASVPQLSVTSRSSAFSFKGQNVDVPTMAEKLNVAHVLEGSVRKSGNQLRITAQLIEAASDKHLWSATYDRKMENVFAIQDEIAAAVVNALRITLLDEGPKATETDTEAYALYLQGRHFFDKGSADSLKQAETLLKRALDIDSRFAPAWTELGSVYLRQTSLLGLRPIDEGNELARDALQQAIAVDPLYGRAYAILATVELRYDRDINAAFKHQQKALALNPGDAAILHVAAELDTNLGRLDEGIRQYQKSIALDPIWPAGHQQLGLAYFFAHRLNEAADSLRMALLLNPGRVGTQFALGRVLLAQGDAPAALAVMEQETFDVFRLTGTAIVQHALGDAGASNAALDELMEKASAGAGYQIAQVYAFRGEVDRAFYWLDQAYDNRDAGLSFTLVDPALANLHDDPRWKPFLDKMGLPH